MNDLADRGRIVGKYEIVARLAAGGMAELFLACSPGPGGFKKFVALKQILPELRGDASLTQMFLDEARLTAALVHPNVGQVFELGIDPARGDPYLAMEFIAGQNLSRLMKVLEKKGLALPLPVACRIVHDACLGLHAAHMLTDPLGRRLGVVHRDVTPNNVMVTYSGHVKVIDFGIARARGNLQRTLPGQIRGTLNYITPEQVLEHPLDARTDIFAAGTILYELLTGRKMHPNELTAPRAVVTDRPPAPSTMVDDIPPALDEAVLKALEKNPEHRHESARMFARAIGDSVALADEEELAGFMDSLFAERRQATQALLESLASEEPEARTLSGWLRELVDVGSGNHQVAGKSVVLGAAAPTKQERALAAPSKKSGIVYEGDRDEDLDRTQIDRPELARGRASLGDEPPAETRQVNAFDMPRPAVAWPGEVVPPAPRPPTSAPRAPSGRVAAPPTSSPRAPTGPVTAPAPSRPRAASGSVEPLSPAPDPVAELFAPPPPRAPSPSGPRAPSGRIESVPAPPDPAELFAPPPARAPSPSGPRAPADPAELFAAPPPRAPSPSGPRASSGRIASPPEPTTADLWAAPPPAAPSGPRAPSGRIAPPETLPELPAAEPWAPPPTSAPRAPSPPPSGPRAPAGPIAASPPDSAPLAAPPPSAPHPAEPLHGARPRVVSPGAPPAPPPAAPEAPPAPGEKSAKFDDGESAGPTLWDRIRWVVALTLLALAVAAVGYYFSQDPRARAGLTSPADAGVRAQ